MGDREYGYVLVGGHRCPVVGLHMCHGALSLLVSIQAGFPGVREGYVTLFGHDDQGIQQFASPVNIPPVMDDAVISMMLIHQ